MPISTTKPVTLATGVVAQHTAIGLTIRPILDPAKGISATAVISSQPYLEVGNGVVPVGHPMTHQVPDIYAAAAASPALAAEVTAITNSLNNIVQILGL